MWFRSRDLISTFSIVRDTRQAMLCSIRQKAALRWSGDVLFKGSVGRTDLPGGDHDTLIKSITEKLLPLGDDVTFICGHGPHSTIGEERATNPFLR